MQPLNLRQLASNFTFLSAGEVLSKICTFIAFTFLARVLGPVNFGYLEFALAVLIFFTLGVDFGTSPYGAREIAKNSNRLGWLISQIITLRILLATAGYIIVIIFVFLLLHDKKPMQNLLLVYGLSLFAIPAFLQWVFQGFDKMRYVAIGSVLRQLVFAACVLVLIRHADQIWLVPWIECVSVTAFALYCVYVLKSRIGKFSFQLTSRGLKSCFIQAMPIGLSELAFAATFYSATVALGYIVGGESVGWFGAAHRIVMAIHTFVWLYFYNMLPSISRCDGQPKELLQSLLQNSIMITSWAAIFIGLFGLILAEPIITIIYGSAYAEAAKTFKVLIWVVVVMFLSGHFGYTLIAFNLQRFLLVCYVYSTIICLALCLFLAPKYQEIGAAVALLTGTVINLGFAYTFVRKKVHKISILRYLVKPVLSGSFTFAVLTFFSPSSLFVSVSLVFIIYISILIALHPRVFLNIRIFFSKS
jgi:PST family polysaccharide transporter